MKTFVQLSTIAVYGTQTHIDTNTPEQPNNPYGESKLLADNALLSLVDNNFNTLIIRPPMVYGGGNAPGNMMRLIKLHSTGIPLPFKGIKEQRDFIHIKNLIGFIDSAIEKNETGVYLVSDNNPISISELSVSIYKTLNMFDRSFWLPKFILKTAKKLVPNIFEKLFGALTIDISESIEKLTFKPKKLLNQGIKEMVG